MSRDIFSCHNWGRCWEGTTGTWRPGMMFIHRMHRTAPHNKKLSSPKCPYRSETKLAKVETPWPQLYGKLQSFLLVKVFFSALEYLKEKYKSFSPIQWFAFIPSITRTAYRSILFIWNLLLLFGFTQHQDNVQRNQQSALSLQFCSNMPSKPSPMNWGTKTHNSLNPI